jgi:LysM repeat protein
VNKRTAPAVTVAAVAIILAACGGERSSDNPPEIVVPRVSTTRPPTTAPTTTVFVPSTAPTTLAPPTNPPPPTAPPTQPTFAPQTAPPTQPTVPVATTGEVYTVVQGDTLFGIATKLGVDMPRLLGANGLHENSLIIPGQRLGVPQGGALPATTAAPPPTQPPPTQPPPTTVPPTPSPTRPPEPQAPVSPSGDRYTVVPGDTLSGIANKLDVPLGQLLKANGMNPNTVIQPGQQLVIPRRGEGPTPPPQTTAARPPTTAGAAAPGAVVPNETAAGCQAEDSTEADGTRIVFAPGNVLDNNPATAWRCETTEADKSLTFTFGAPTRLTSVGLFGG